MPNSEDTQQTSFFAMLVGHWAEIILFALAGLLSYIATDFVSEFRKHTESERVRLNKLEERIRVGEIASEGNRYRIQNAESDIEKLENKLDSMVIMSGRSWQELENYRHEKRKNYDPNR